MPRKIGKMLRPAPAEARASSEVSARIQWIQAQFHRYHKYWEPDLARAVRNTRMYWHINFGQWAPEVVKRLKEQGQRPPTIPVIPDKVETLVGSLVANGFDIKFEPADGGVDSLTLMLQDMWYSDSSNMDWESPELEALVDMCIYCGYERMYVSDRNDPLGNLAFERINPLHVLTDPSWKSNDPYDIRSYFVWDNLTANEIMARYPKAGEKIAEQREREKIEGVDYGLNEIQFNTWDEKWGGPHRVLEFHHVATKESWAEFDTKNHIFLPDTGKARGSDDDRALKLKYITDNGLSSEDIQFIRKNERIARVEAVCPALSGDTFLTKGDDPIQTGTVNLYPIGMRYHGQHLGIVVDRIYDMQIAINKGEMNMSDIQTRSAKGAYLLSESITGGDDQKREAIEADWNKPGAKIWIDEDADLRSGNLIIPLPATPLTSDVISSVNRNYDMADRFSKVNAAADARVESSKESGKLFRYKLEAGQISQKIPMKLYEKHKEHKARAYAEQCKITYAGMSRTFTKSGGESITVNRPTYNVLTGDLVVEDDVSTLPKMRVIITPSPSGISVRQDQRQQASEILALMNDPRDRLIRLIALGTILDTAEQSDASKEEYKKALALCKAQAALDIGSQIQNSKNAIKQGQLQDAGLEQQFAGPPQQPAVPGIPQQAGPGVDMQAALQGTPQQ